MSTTTNTYIPQNTTDQKLGQEQQPGYVQQAYDGAANLATTAANTISGALSGAAAVNPFRAEPSETSYRNRQPHVGGVGDLGTSSEADVTRLPEERANPDPYSGAPVADLAQPNPAITDPSLIQGAMNTRNEKFAPGVSGAGVAADQQYRNRQPHVGGVGDLGTSRDEDVARLPEERVNPNPMGAEYRNHQPHVGGVGDLGTAGDADVVRLPTERTVDQPSTTEKAAAWTHRTMGDITHPGHSGGVSGSNHDTDHGLGGPHRGVEPEIHDAQQRQGYQHDDQQGTEEGGDGAAHPKMKDKLKGSLLIAKGKITRDREDVAQGRLLKSTGTTESPAATHQ